MGTVRLTVAQALVRFLANQYSERDGVQQRLIPGCFGIFGHGNVAGVGSGAAGSGHHRLRGPAVLPGPQRTGHGARRRRLRQDPQPPAGTGLHGVHRSGVGEHADRRGAGHNQPGSGAVAGQRHFRHPGRQPGAAGAGTAQRVRHLGQRRLPAAVPVLRPGVAARAAAAGDARRDAGAQRPGRDRCGDTRPAAGRAGRRPRLAGGTVRQTRLVRATPGAGALRTGQSRCRDPGRRNGHCSISGGGVIYSEATEALARFAAATGIPVADTQAGKGGIRWDHPQAVGGVGSTGSPVANALARDADLVIGVGTRYSDFTTASKTAFQNPDVSFVNLNVTALDAAKNSGVMLVADARNGLEALTAALAGYRVPRCVHGRARQAPGSVEHRGGQRLPPRSRPAARADRGPGRAQRVHRPVRHRRPGRRLDARRPADALAGRGPQAVPRRIRVLLHGV